MAEWKAFKSMTYHELKLDVAASNALYRHESSVFGRLFIALFWSPKNYLLDKDLWIYAHR